MNKPDKAGEPSMDEILASIRQIIADEPASSPAAGNPLMPKQATADSARTAQAGAPKELRPQPLLDRLNGVIKTPQPPTSPFGSKRPVPFDQDLADMLDDAEADGAAPNAAPKPDIRMAPELATPLAKTESQSAAVDGSVMNAALPPLPAPGPAASAPAPTVEDAVLPEQPAPPRTFGFPPLKKQGFYPPQPKVAPASATPTSPSPAQPSPSPGVFGSGAFAALASSPPSVFAAGAAPEPFGAGFGPAGPQTQSDVPAAVSRIVVDDDSLSDALAATLGGRARPIQSAPSPLRSEVEAPLAARPAAIEPVSAPDPFPSPGVRLGPTTEATAAAQALDALAQGLAASAAASAFSGAMPSNSTSSGHVPEAHAQLLPSVLSPAPPRTLEDAVADMLRPLLQQWVAENMPRIIERALRAEAVNPIKPGPHSR
jgi:cell pole-organizing protein PopZ